MNFLLMLLAYCVIAGRLFDFTHRYCFCFGVFFGERVKVILFKSQAVLFFSKLMPLLVDSKR